MITLHHEKERNFDLNGYGALDDFIFNDGGSWEMNGEFKITFEVPALTEFTKYLKVRNIVQAPVPFMERQLFRIYRTEQTLTSIYIEARHIFYDLLDNWIEDTNIVNQVGNSAIQQLLSRTQYPHRFTATSNISKTANARIVRMNPVEAIIDDGKENTLVSRWGGELVRNNFHIEMLERMGVDRGVRIEHKKDLMGYNATIDVSTIVTRIHPVGFDGLELPEKYVDSPLIDLDHPIIAEMKYEDVKAAVGEYTDDEEAVPLEEALNLLRQAAADEFAVNHVDEPETVVEVDFVALHNTEQYKQFTELQEVKAGDTVKVSAPDHGFEITSRLVAFEFSLIKKDHYTSTTLGNHVFEFTSGSADIRDIRKELDESFEQLNIIQTAANGKNTIFRGPDTPEARKVGDLWYKPAGNGEIEMYQWNGEMWELVVSTGVNTEIAERIKEAKDAADGAQEEAESAANRVQTAIDNAADAYEYADSAIRAANGKNTVYRGDQQPTEGKENDIWFQSVVENGEEATKMYVHDGSAWVLRAHDASDLAGTLDLSQLNVINLNMDSATGGSLHLDRGLKVTNNDKDVLKVENGNVTMDVDNLLIQSQGLDEVMSTSFYQDGLAVGMMYEENGEIKSIFNLGPNGPYLSGKNIVLNGNTVVDGTFTVTDEIFAENMSISKFTAGTLNAANVNLINVNVSSLVGDTAEFIRTGWNKVNSRADINGSRLRFTHNDGTATEIGASGIRRVTPSDNRAYHYLIYATTFIRGVSSSNAHWIQLPDDFKGKDFKVYLAVADSMNALNYKRSIQRFVCTIHPGHNIDYARARVPIIGYKSETLGDGVAPEITSVQGLLWAIY